MRRREPTARQLSSWQEEIARNGTKRITARLLLRTFGIQRRGPLATTRVVQWLQQQTPAVYATGLEHVQSLDDAVFLSHIELTQIGRPAETERSLVERFEVDIMPQLGLLKPQPKFRPPGSRDELDFLCEDKQGRSVVVEIKKEDGERRVVEQVVRYIRLVRQVPACREPRGVIVTGIADLHTRRVLEELEPQYHIDWFVYGIDARNSIRVQQVPVRGSRPAVPRWPEGSA